MSITNRQRDIILGLLLGDGHLEKNGNNVRLRIDQAVVHSDYVVWLYRELKNLATAKPRIIAQKDNRTNKIYRRLHFSTYSNVEFNAWWKMFYPKREKIIPSTIGNMLNSELSLAIWLMDDGYKRNDCAAIRLNTDAFSYDGQQRLIRCLQTNFKIMAHLHKKGKWFNIYIPKGEAKKFCMLVKPYILQSFRHKLL